MSRPCLTDPVPGVSGFLTFRAVPHQGPLVEPPDATAPHPVVDVAKKELFCRVVGFQYRDQPVVNGNDGGAETDQVNPAYGTIVAHIPQTRQNKGFGRVRILVASDPDRNNEYEHKDGGQGPREGACLSAGHSGIGLYHFL